MTPLRSWSPVVFLACLASCDSPGSAPSRPPPPPLPVAKASPCAGGGGAVNDPVSGAFFPKAVAGFCVDPDREARTYGEKAKLDMDAVCTTAFDGECAVYDQFGLKRLVSMDYVAAQGGAAVEVYLSRFADEAGAYGMFTKRVIADSDPTEPSVPKPLAAGGAGAIGTGRAYVWKNEYLVELQYNDEQATPEALIASSAKALPALGKAIGDALPGSSSLPPSAAALPAEHRITNGVQLLPKDALGVHGLGPLAVGFYADGKTRWRDLAVAGSDEAHGKEAWKLLKARPGALPVAGVGDEAIAVTLPWGSAPEAPKREMIVARKGALVAGVGDEVFGAGAPLTREQKIERLKAWLAPPGPAKK